MKCLQQAWLRILQELQFVGEGLEQNEMQTYRSFLPRKPTVLQMILMTSMIFGGHYGLFINNYTFMDLLNFDF